MSEEKNVKLLDTHADAAINIKQKDTLSMSTESHPVTDMHVAKFKQDGDDDAIKRESKKLLDRIKDVIKRIHEKYSRYKRYGYLKYKTKLMKGKLRNRKSKRLRKRNR